MFRIDANKYKNFATASGNFYFEGKSYNVDFPTKSEGYQRPFGASYWDKFTLKHIYVDLFYLDEDSNWVDAGRNVQVYFEDHLDEILQSSGRFILKYYGSTRRAGATYFADDKGIWKFSKKTSDKKLFWRIPDNSYEDRYMAQRRKLTIPGARRRFLFLPFLQEAVDVLHISDFDEALEAFSNDPDRFSYLPDLVDDYDMNDPIISISKPDITRQIGNKDTKTFDFVNVEILLRSTLEFTDFDEYIRDNLYDFNKRALKRIGADNRYLKYGVPTKFLHLYSISKHARTGLRFSYELKNGWSLTV